MNEAACISAQNLRRVFIDGARKLEVLRDVSVSLKRAEVAALVGLSGSGKSTLLHILGLLDRPNEGEVLIDGTPTARLSENQRSQLRNERIGFVFQHYFLLPELNVIENVLVPAKIAAGAAQWAKRKAEFDERAESLLKLVALSDQRAQMPKTLSGGERQRVALARALILNPPILLCDEPTGNLDPDTGARIMDLIFSLSSEQRAAVLVVTHDMSLSGRAKRVLRLDHGALKVEKCYPGVSDCS